MFSCVKGLKFIIIGCTNVIWIPFSSSRGLFLGYGGTDLIATIFCDNIPTIMLTGIIYTSCLATTNCFKPKLIGIALGPWEWFPCAIIIGSE